MMPGICCCDSWQDWGKWDTEHYSIAEESVRSQVKRLRIHPSVFVFVYVFFSSNPFVFAFHFLLLGCRLSPFFALQFHFSLFAVGFGFGFRLRIWFLYAYSLQVFERRASTSVCGTAVLVCFYVRTLA